MAFDRWYLVTKFYSEYVYSDLADIEAGLKNIILGVF